MRKADLIGRWRLAGYEAASKADVVYPMGRFVGASNLRHADLHGDRLVLSGT